MRVVLETERLVLRELVPGDLEFVAGMLGDAAAMRFYPQVYGREAAWAWLSRQRERYARDGHGLWLVEEKATGRAVGQIGLLEQRVGPDVETEVGYLVARAHWGRGFATEAAAACRDRAFRALGRRRVVSLVRPDNLPSAAVARRLGMYVEKTCACFGVPHHVFVATPHLAPDELTKRSVPKSGAQRTSPSDRKG